MCYLKAHVYGVSEYYSYTVYDVIIRCRQRFMHYIISKFAFAYASSRAKIKTIKNTKKY